MLFTDDSAACRATGSHPGLVANPAHALGVIADLASYAGGGYGNRDRIAWLGLVAGCTAFGAAIG